MMTNLGTLRNVLKDNYDVKIATSVPLALKILNESKVELILSDIEMPDINGFEFMALLKKVPKLSKIPFIFVTSHSSKEFVSLALKQGAKYFIVKPIDPALLRSRVASVLAPVTKVDASDPIIVNALMALRGACEKKSYSDVISLTTDIRRMRFDKETDSLVSNLASCTMSFNFNDSIQIIDSILQ